uniref:Ribonuclease H-like domain-containing protein n=1 Tax=Tanacetum cinerariifolium TaxID=118510 RepID=A0A699H3G7_TANCI|nr:ribonuclease H-like domain-containing protein [Tanacetum cinerariifolium]
MVAASKVPCSNLAPKAYESVGAFGEIKILRSLSPEWNTHVFAWRNKANFDTISMDDLYNNLKVYKPEVKGMSSSSSGTQNMAFVSSSNNNTSNTNRAVNIAQASATTATREDILLGSAELQEIKTTRTKKAQVGVCLWKHLLLQLWCHVMVLVDKTRVIRQRKGQIMHSWLSHLQVMTQNLMKSELMVLGYKTGLKSVEERLEFFLNEFIYLEDIKVLKVEIQMGEIAIRELRKKLKKARKEKDGIQISVNKFKHASKSLNKLIDYQIVDNCKKGLGYKTYNAVPPPYIGNFMPPTHDFSFTGLDEFVNKHVVENYKAKSSEEEPKVVRKNDDASIIEEYVSDNKEEDVSQPKTEKKTVRPSIAKIKFVKSKQQKKTARKIVKQVKQHRQNTYSPIGN